MNKDLSIAFEGYDEFIAELKQQIRTAQIRAGLAVNSELVLLYWHIGKRITGQQEARGWGSKVIDKIAAYLQRAFPAVRGFSTRNLKYMRAMAVAWPVVHAVKQH